MDVHNTKWTCETKSDQSKPLERPAVSCDLHPDEGGAGLGSERPEAMRLVLFGQTAAGH